jgi:hypothetical protein
MYGDTVNLNEFCEECTTGLEIILAHLMVFLGDVGQVEARFGQFGDSVKLDAR